jgi:hypothetical protein
MYRGSKRELRFPLAACVSYQERNRGKYSLLVRAYTTCELGDQTPKNVEEFSEKRSATETAVLNRV